MTTNVQKQKKDAGLKTPALHSNLKAEPISIACATSKVGQHWQQQAQKKTGTTFADCAHRRETF